MSVRFEQRIQETRWLSVTTPVAAGVVGLLITAVVLVVIGYDPVSTYRRMLDASVTSAAAITATLTAATPLLLTGLAAAVAFRTRVWNIGGEGQLFIGALLASAVGIALGSHGLAVVLPAMLIAGAAGGLAWVLIPAILKTRLHTNEILTTLMFNYIGGLLIYYVIFDSHSYWRDVSNPAALSYPQGKTLDPSAFWPTVHLAGVSVPLGLIIGVVLAIGVFVLLRGTHFGLQMRVVADVPAAGRYAGIRTTRTILLVLLLSAALAGLAGASQVGDFSHTLEPQGLPLAALGYTGIVVAALARFNPLGILVSALFVGGLTNAGFELQSATFPIGLVGVMTGLILFCVLGGEFLLRYRLRVVRGGSEVGRASGSDEAAPHAPEPVGETVPGGR